MNDHLLKRAGAVMLVAGLFGSVQVGLATTAQAATTAVITANKVDTSDTRKTGHNDFSTNGVHIWTEGSTSTDKAAGYFDSGIALAAAGEPSMAWTATAGVAQTVKPGLQLVTDFDGDGSADGILVGEPTYADGSALYGSNWWLSNSSSQFVKDGAPSHDGGYGSADNGTLDQWRTAFPKAKIISAGWSLGSGVKGDGTISSITVGTTTYTFAPAPAVAKTTVKVSAIDFSQTRSNGYWALTKDNALHVWTDGTADKETVAGVSQNSDKVAGYFAAGLKLSDALPSALNYTNTSATSVPGSQLVIDINGDGIEDGTLVGEPIVPGIYWLARNTLTHGATTVVAPRAAGSTGVPGYSAGGGTAAEWRVAYPNAKVIQVGFSLGSGAKGDGLLTSIQAGNTLYSFTGPVPTPSAKCPTFTVHGNATGATNAVSATMPVSPVTEGYTFTVGPVTHGTAAVVGRTITFTPAAGFVGTAYVAYKANDGSRTVAGVITVNVTDDMPHVWPVALSTTVGVPVTATLAGQDSDDPVGSLVYTVDAKVSHGTATVAGNQLTFTPTAGYKGTVKFTYYVSDGLKSDHDVVVVTIK